MKYPITFTFPKRYEDRLVTVMRVMLAIIFIWFGILKMMGYNPVHDLVYNSIMPALAAGTGLFILGAVEALIGVMLLLNRALVLTHILVHESRKRAELLVV